MTQPPLTFTETQRRTAALALLDLADGTIKTSEINAVLKGAAESIARGETIAGDRAEKYTGAYLLFSQHPIKARFLGGTRQANLADRLTRTLDKIDTELLAEIYGIAQHAYKKAADRVAVKIRHQASRSGLNPMELWSLDHDPAPDFIAGLREPVRDRICASLTKKEKELVEEELEAATVLIDAALKRASQYVIKELPKEVRGDAEKRHGRSRPAALRLFMAAMSRVVLSRLGRGKTLDIVTDDTPVSGPDPDTGGGEDTGEAAGAPPAVPMSILVDVMRAAAGAAVSKSGRLVRNNSGDLLNSDGEVFRGTNFAQGDATTSPLEQKAALESVVIFQHSGHPDPNPLHLSANGKPVKEVAAKLYHFPGCYCRERAIYTARE